MARRLEREQFVGSILPSPRRALSDRPGKRRRVDRSRTISILSRHPETSALPVTITLRIVSAHRNLNLSSADQFEMVSECILSCAVLLVRDRSTAARDSSRAR